MKTSYMIRELCEKQNISISELARHIGQTPQNFGKKLKRETITLDEMKQIAEVMDDWSSQESMMKLAMKNNLFETAF